MKLSILARNLVLKIILKSWDFWDGSEVEGNNKNKVFPRQSRFAMADTERVVSVSSFLFCTLLYPLRDVQLREDSLLSLLHDEDIRGEWVYPDGTTV